MRPGVQGYGSTLVWLGHRSLMMERWPGQISVPGFATWHTGSLHPSGLCQVTKPLTQIWSGWLLDAHEHDGSGCGWRWRWGGLREKEEGQADGANLGHHHFQWCPTAPIQFLYTATFISNAMRTDCMCVIYFIYHLNAEIWLPVERIWDLLLLSSKEVEEACFL